MRMSLLMSLLLALGAAPATQEANLLINGGFEQGMSGWTLGPDNNMSRLTPDAARSGTRGLRVTDEDIKRGSALFSPQFPTQPGKAYVVTFHARRRADGRVNVYIQFFDNAGKPLTTTAKKNLNTTGVRRGEESESWQEYTSKPAIAPEGATKVRLAIQSANVETGAADFDDFVFIEMPPAQ